MVRRALGDREGQETFALDELTRAMDEDPVTKDQIRRYSARIVGEAFTQTGRALRPSPASVRCLRTTRVTNRFVIALLERHRVRLDRLGIDTLDDEDE